MNCSFLEYANRKFGERIAPVRDENADVTEGRLLVAVSSYPIDLIKGLFCKKEPDAGHGYSR